MNESIEEALSHQETDDHITEIHQAAEHIQKTFRRGIWSEDEMNRRAADVLDEGVLGFLKRKNLCLWIKARDWVDFQNAIHAWREDREDQHLRVCSWLYFEKRGPVRGYFATVFHGEEAAVSDKANVLRFLEACHVPIEYFRPVPEDIACPDDYPAHFPGEYVIGWNIWETDDEPVKGKWMPGETRTLVDHHGLKTVIRIDQVFGESEKKHPGDADCIGTGTIEGYTSSRPREIKVFMEDGEVDCLTFFRGNDDNIDFPLWRAFNEDREEIHRIREKIIRDLMNNPAG